MCALRKDEKKLLASAIALLAGMALMLAFAFAAAGCSQIGGAGKYVPGQQFGDGGATACVDASGNPVVNHPKQWLKCCE